MLRRIFGSRWKESPTIAQAVSRRLPTAEAQINAQVSPCGIVVDKVALGQVFLRVLRFSPVRIIPLLLHIHSCIIWGIDKGPVRGPVTQRHSLIPSQQFNSIQFLIISVLHQQPEDQLQMQHKREQNNKYNKTTTDYKKKCMTVEKVST
jgi:hypothetical protein